MAIQASLQNLRPRTHTERIKAGAALVIETDGFDINQAIVDAKLTALIRFLTFSAQK